MIVTVEYVAQMKDAAGVASDTIEIPEGSTIQDALRAVVRAHGDRLARLVLDDTGQLRPDALVFLGDEQADWNSPSRLPAGSRLTLLAPLAGG